MEITGGKIPGNGMRFCYKIAFLVESHFKLNDQHLLSRSPCTDLGSITRVRFAYIFTCMNNSQIFHYIRNKQFWIFLSIMHECLLNFPLEMKKVGSLRITQHTGALSPYNGFPEKPSFILNLFFVKCFPLLLQSFSNGKILIMRAWHVVPPAFRSLPLLLILCNSLIYPIMLSGITY